MVASAPSIINGKTFDRYSLNLAITGIYNGDGTPDACISLLLTPTRIAPAIEDDAGIRVPARAELAPRAARSILRGSFDEVRDPAEVAAIAAIQAALQAYLVAKGL
jgi:hypothetical protein